MAASVLGQMAADLNDIAGLEAQLVPVVNQFWGPLVTVAGLLCGQDVLDVLAAMRLRGMLGDIVVLPRVMLDTTGTRFLDDVTVDNFRTQVPERVELIRNADELGALIQSLV